MIPFAGGHVDPGAWRTFENLVCLRQTSSSNDLAGQLIELYFEEEQDLPPLVLIADEQPLARGRRGRWQAPPGRGLYLTFVRRVAPKEPVSLVPIAVARWMADALREATRTGVELKWPNDLYVGRRKVAGILAECRTQGEQTYMSVGIGLNVLGRAAELGVAQATTLEQEAGRPFVLAPLLQTLLDRFDRELADPRWDAEVGRWQSASLHHPGDRVKVLRDGGELTGEYVGLSPEGFLRIKTSTGEAVLPSGELAEW